MKYLILTCLVIAGCADAPSGPPPTREQLIQRAVASTYAAGGDGEARYEQLHLQWCLYDAQEIQDSTKHSAALARCRTDWPQKADTKVSFSN